MDDFLLNDDGQLQMNTNYKGPANGELIKIWNPLLVKMGKTTVLAEKALVMGIKNIRYRDPNAPEDSEEERKFARIAEEMHGVDGFKGYISEMSCLELMIETESGTGGSAYQRVYKLMKDRVFKNSWSIIADNGSRGYTEIEAITATHIDENGRIYISWNDEVAKKILELRDGYTLFDEKLLYGFNSDIAIQLYKILKRNICLADSRRKKMGLEPLPEYEFKINLSELKFQLNELQFDITSKDEHDIEIVRLIKAKKFEDAEALVVEKEMKAGAKVNYHAFKYFKRDKLSKAYTEINGFAEPKSGSGSSEGSSSSKKSQKEEAAIKEYERLCGLRNSTDLHFRYSHRRNTSYVSLFVRWANLSSAGKYDNFLEGEFREVPETKAEKAEKPEKVEKTTINEDEILDEMLTLSKIPELQKIRNLRVIAEDAGWDIDRIRKAFKVIEGKELETPIGYLRDAIKYNWEPVEKKPRKKPSSEGKATKSAESYNSYSSHTYTPEQMADIQKRLLKKKKDK